MQEETRVAQAGRSSSFKWIENAHILVWLIKDTCWALMWRPLGIFMILPAIGMSLYILFRSRGNRCDMLHNAAVVFWITANSTWMLGEFYAHDLRHIAVIFFVCGLLMLVIYYLFFFKADRRAELAAQTETVV